MYKGSPIKAHLHNISESYALLFTWEYGFDLVSLGGWPFSAGEVCGGNVYVLSKTLAAVC
jgi:hypothetical protein